MCTRVETSTDWASRRQPRDSVSILPASRQAGEIVTLGPLCSFGAWRESADSSGNRLDDRSRVDFTAYSRRLNECAVGVTKSRRHQFGGAF